MPQYRESFVVFIATETPACFWTGHGDLSLPADDVFDAPRVVTGAGDLVNLPDLEGLLNGTAQRAEITLSGVANETMRFAAEEADQVPGSAVHIGRIEFDDAWQVATPVAWEWTGEAQKLTISGGPAQTGRSRSITLRIAAGDTTRARAPFAFFTDADQTRDFPDDAIFTNVASITAGTSRRWGPK